MTQEEKKLVLKDLCARLPYAVKVQCNDKIITLDKKYCGIGVLYPEDMNPEYRDKIAGFAIIISGCYYGEDVKPYLRPMSSMTEEEENEYKDTCVKINGLNSETSLTFDWLNEHHFDYRGLIEKGLALETPEGMYKFE